MSAQAQDPGTVVADSGFLPAANGFSFANYGAAPDSELTAADMQSIFGNVVCVDRTSATCDLTPPAQAWMNTENKGASGGHCSGFSVTSLLFYKNDLAPAAFGGPTVPALPLPGNVVLQRRIAQSALFQTFEAVNAGKFTGTPNEMLDKLIAVLNPTVRETYTISIFKLDNTGGHAVTPYSVVDRGNDRFGVLIYENNEPGVVKEILFDRAANTWTYDARTNPSEPTDTYTGTAQSKTLSLLPTTPGIGVQPCPFCPAPTAAQAAPGTRVAAADRASSHVEVDLEGNPRDHAHLLVTDGFGGQIGFQNGQLVRQMPGARADVETRSAPHSSQYRLEPRYSIPSDRAYTIAIDGSPVKGVDPTDINIIGPGFDLKATDTTLRHGEQGQLGFSADGRQLTYHAGSVTIPTFKMGRDEGGVDHAFTVHATPVWAGSELTLREDPDRFTIKTGLGPNADYDIAFERAAPSGDVFFTYNHLVLPSNVTAQVLYQTFTQEHTSVTLQIIHADGRVETRPLPDQS